MQGRVKRNINNGGITLRPKKRGSGEPADSVIDRGGLHPMLGASYNWSCIPAEHHAFGTSFVRGNTYSRCTHSKNAHGHINEIHGIWPRGCFCGRTSLGRPSRLPSYPGGTQSTDNSWTTPTTTTGSWSGCGCVSCCASGEPDVVNLQATDSFLDNMRLNGAGWLDQCCSN